MRFSNFYFRRLTLFWSVLRFTLSPLYSQVDAEPETDVGVAVARVIRITLHEKITLYGTIAGAPFAGPTRPAGQAQLVIAASGRVGAIFIAEGGDVQAGTVIVQLDSDVVDAAVAGAELAVVAAEKARDRQVRLREVAGASEKAMQEVEVALATARQELAKARWEQSLRQVRAPLSGTVTRLTVAPGDWVDSGQALGELVDADRLVVMAHVPVDDAAMLKYGQPAVILDRLGAEAKIVAQATVDFVSSRVTAGRDQVEVRLALASGSLLKSGRLVVARVTTAEHADRLAVPEESVFTDEAGRSTMSVVTGEHAKQGEVQAGLREGGWVEVAAEGLAEGTVVVTSGSYALPEETKIHVIAAMGEDGK